MRIFLQDRPVSQPVMPPERSLVRTGWIAMVLMGLALSSHSVAAQVSSGPKADLPALLEATRRHPRTVYRQSEIDAARRRVSQRTSLNDPMLMFGIQNLPTNSFRLNAEMMTSKIIGLSQHFPFPGKLAREGEMATAEISMMTAEESESEIALRRDVKQAYYDIYHLDKSIETDVSHLGVLDEIVRLAGARVSTAKASQQDVLSLKLEEAQTRSDLANERAMMVMRLADLGMASGVPQDSIVISDSLAMDSVTLTLDQLDSIARLHSPMIKSGLVGIETATASLARAKLEGYPDLDVSLMYMQRDAIAGDPPMTQSDMVSLVFGVNLPIWRTKVDNAEQESEAMLVGARSKLSAVELEIRSKLDGLLAKLHGIREQYKLLINEVLPLTEESLKTTTTNYTYGSSSVEEVLRTQLALLHKVHDRYQYEAEYNKAVAELEYTLGIDLNTR